MERDIPGKRLPANVIEVDGELISVLPEGVDAEAFAAQTNTRPATNPADTAQGTLEGRKVEVLPEGVDPQAYVDGLNFHVD